MRTKEDANDALNNICITIGLTLTRVTYKKGRVWRKLGDGM